MSKTISINPVIVEEVKAILELSAEADATPRDDWSPSIEHPADYLARTARRLERITGLTWEELARLAG